MVEMDVGVEMEMEIPPGARPIGHATQGFWGGGRDGDGRRKMEMEMETPPGARPIGHATQGF